MPCVRLLQIGQPLAIALQYIQDCGTPIPSHPHDAGLFNPNILNRERREVRPIMYRRSPYMDLPPTTILPKKQGDKTKNKGKNANVSSLNLGDAFADDNVGRDDVMIMGERDTGNLLVYENVNPSKVRREDYIDSTKFLLNPYDVYLDCYMMGYLVSDFFWRQLVPHLYMTGFHSLERPNEEGWLSGDHMNAWIELLIRERPQNAKWTVSKSGTVYMPINAGGNHWVTDWTPVVNDILQSRGCFNGTGRQPYNFIVIYNQGLGYPVPQQPNFKDCRVITCWLISKLCSEQEPIVHGDSQLF
ncbi:phospholipase-like protein [Tanacetum coccineum]